MTPTTLSSDRLHEIFMDCLFRDEELPANGSPHNAVIVEGVQEKFGFHPDRLSSHREEIVSLLAELPDQFHADKGGGWSFLNACQDRNGHQWTGEHRSMDQLFALGQAIGAVSCLLPREMWGALPGGMPYYTVNTATA